jgi:hypothetical protein
LERERDGLAEEARDERRIITDRAKVGGDLFGELLLQAEAE